jgi:hypothetical protein
VAGRGRPADRPQLQAFVGRRLWPSSRSPEPSRDRTADARVGQHRAAIVTVAVDVALFARPDGESGVAWGTRCRRVRDRRGLALLRPAGRSTETRERHDRTSRRRPRLGPASRGSSRPPSTPRSTPSRSGGSCRWGRRAAGTGVSVTAPAAWKRSMKRSARTGGSADDRLAHHIDVDWTGEADGRQGSAIWLPPRHARRAVVDAVSIGRTTLRLSEVATDAASDGAEAFRSQGRSATTACEAAARSRPRPRP